MQWRVLFKPQAHRTWTIFMVLSFITLYLSRLCWYDIRTIYAAQGLASPLRIQFLIWTVLLLPFMGYFFLQLPYFVKKYRFFAIWAVICTIYFAVGAIRQQFSVYFLQDIVKYSFFPALVIAALNYMALSPNHKDRLLRLCFYITLIFILLRVLFFLLLSEKGAPFLYGTPTELFPLFFATAAAVFYLRKGQWPLYACTSVLVIALIFLGQKKQLILFFPLAYLLYGILSLKMSKRYQRLSVMGMITLMSAGIILVLLSTMPERFPRLIKNPVIVSFFDSLSPTSFADAVQQTSIRLKEVHIAFEKLQKKPLLYLTGMGAGMTLDMHFPHKGSYKIHSMHNTPTALLIRHGLIGVFLFFYLIYFGYAKLWYHAKETQNTAVLALLGYKLCVGFVCMFSFGIIDDAILALAIAYVLHDEKQPVYTRALPLLKQ